MYLIILWYSWLIVIWTLFEYKYDIIMKLVGHNVSDNANDGLDYHWIENHKYSVLSQSKFESICLTNIHGKECRFSKLIWYTNITGLCFSSHVVCRSGLVLWITLYSCTQFIVNNLDSSKSKFLHNYVTSINLI